MITQQYLSTKTSCGKCNTWRTLAADTWGATYREPTVDEQSAKDNVTTAVIEDVKLINVSIL